MHPLFKIILGTKGKREKIDKEMEAACLISSANGSNINTVAPSATKSFNATSTAVMSISVTLLSMPCVPKWILPNAQGSRGQTDSFFQRDGVGSSLFKALSRVREGFYGQFYPDTTTAAI